LIYSQWRTLEGIGLFKMVLEANGLRLYDSSEGKIGWIFIG